LPARCSWRCKPAHDPQQVHWAKDALVTENNVLRMADPVTGQVAMFGAVNESGAASPLLVLL
jgi:hypothetical protein